MATFTVHQRKLSSDQVDEMNRNSSSDMTNAYFKMTFPNSENVDELVAAHFEHGIYKMTSCLQVISDNPLDAIFHQLNGYDHDDVENQIILMSRRPSMSVGDIVTDTGSGVSWVCMPHGWHELGMQIETKLAA